MNLATIIRRTAWRAGAGEDLTDRIVEAFLTEVAGELAGGRAVDLPPVGRLGPYGAFEPRPAVRGDVAGAGVPDLPGYDEAVPPRDS
jgi:hypothetical protein